MSNGSSMTVSARLAATRERSSKEFCWTHRTTRMPRLSSNPSLFSSSLALTTILVPVPPPAAAVVVAAIDGVASSSRYR